MRTIICILNVIAAASGLAAAPDVALHATSAAQQPPPPAVAATPPAAPVVWLISEGPHAIKVLIRDQSTNEDVFRIDRRPAGPGSWTLVADIRLASLTPGTGFELPYTDQPLAENAEYHYRVRAGRTPLAAGPILWSDAVVLSGRTRIDPGPPAPDFCASVAPDDCRATFRLSSGRDLTYYSSYPLDELRLSITRVVLAVHGVSRNARGAFNSLVTAATSADVRSETLIVSPLFDEDGWSGAWKEGGWSFEPGRISSFAAADELILALTDPANFPNVREVVVAGHSAGGQFTQRFAATSSIDGDRPGLKYRFVVANPSSYVYLNDLRPNASTPDYSIVRFGTPDRCPTYNTYKFGLDERSGYVGHLTSDQIRAQYMRRYVVYLLGDNDNDINAADLDHSCEADVQGAHRLARGQFYYRHMMLFYRWNRHRRLVVPGVGHRGGAMFNSPNGREALFF
jgi:hypothetical protein